MGQPPTCGKQKSHGRPCLCNFLGCNKSLDTIKGITNHAYVKRNCLIAQQAHLGVGRKNRTDYGTCRTNNCGGDNWCWTDTPDGRQKIFKSNNNFHYKHPPLLPHPLHQLTQDRHELKLCILGLDKYSLVWIEKWIYFNTQCVFIWLPSFMRARMCAPTLSPTDGISCDDWSLIWPIDHQSFWTVIA